MQSYKVAIFKGIKTCIVGYNFVALQLEMTYLELIKFTYINYTLCSY